MATMLSIDIQTLDLFTLNELIDKGERFYVTTKNPEYTDDIWITNHAFWGDGKSDDTEER